MYCENYVLHIFVEVSQKQIREITRIQIFQDGAMCVVLQLPLEWGAPSL